MLGRLFILSMLAVMGIPGANASVDIVKSGPPDGTDFSSPLNPLEEFQRTRAVLDYFHVPEEADTLAAMEALQGSRSFQSVSRLLPFIDNHSQFSRYVNATDQTLDFFQDRDSKTVADFNVSLIPDGQPGAAVLSLARILAARKNPADKPLQGLRIALDPGHMGTDYWDELTGKFVHDTHGNKLSEGTLTLQTATLLASDFQALGAETMITRYRLAPVTGVDYNTFSPQERQEDQLRSDVLLNWFRLLLPTSPAGPELFHAFDQSPEVKRVFSDLDRVNYYTSIDLQARVDAISAFNPDLTIIIHYDAGNTVGDQNGVNTESHDGTKTYVAGAFDTSEFATRGDRVSLAQHLLSEPTWDASVALSKSLAGQVSSGLGIGFDPQSPGNTARPAPGVYSRNLYLLKKLPGFVVSYIECLFYNDPKEFEALRSPDHTIQIDGQSLPYSDRLLQVEQALKAGTVSFVKNFEAGN